jgi:hypothetical protein
MTESNINANPLFNMSMGAVGYVDRFDRGVSDSQNVYSIARVMEFSRTITFSPSVQTISVNHGLGFRPMITGLFKFSDKDEPRVLGDHPARDSMTDGHLWIDDVDTESLTIGFLIDSTGSTATINFELYLLDNESN